MPNQSPNNKDMVISYLTIRKAVGILGLTFSLILFLGSLLFGECTELKDSVSSYYYTAMGSYFTGTLCAVGLFLFTYKGYDDMDKLLSNAGGIFALGIVFFPTNETPGCDICIQLPNCVLNTIHYISAGLFFVTMAYISGIQFTKTAPGETPGGQKQKRNKVYRTCAIVMLVAMALIPCLKIKAIPASFFNYKPEFWLETIVLMAFGISWLIKGKTLLKD